VYTHAHEEVPIVPLTPEQRDYRRRTNTFILRVASIVFMLMALLLLLTATGIWWRWVIFLLVGSFMALACFPRFTRYP
jgi:fatty acid desaturase